LIRLEKLNPIHLLLVKQFVSVFVLFLPNNFLMPNFLKANWQQLIMANYAIPPAVLEPYLPAGVELDWWDGSAWASLVGFMFKDTRIFKIPIPLLGNFEEINLRFYVKRKDVDGYKRGVVFINESVPYRMVAWMANWLYKEHYSVLKTRHRWQETGNAKQISYEWLVNKAWNKLEVMADRQAVPMAKGSFQEFIFEHYFGYTKVSATVTEEYQVKHPSWLVNEVKSYSIECDFNAMYGVDFAFLNSQAPSSVFLAAGSAVAIDWKRRKLKGK
jgi:uncharacterized protein